MEWHDFDLNNGNRQHLPHPRQWVLVRCRANIPGYPDPVIAGWMRYVNGDKDYPEFITPGAGIWSPCAWSDCLPEGFTHPTWPDDGGE
jgi:hypothetical protein